MPLTPQELGASVRQLRAQLLTAPAPVPPPPSALEAAALLAASPDAGPDDVAAALSALAFLALPRENREPVGAAIEAAGADLVPARAPSEDGRAALPMLLLRLSAHADAADRP